MDSQLHSAASNASYEAGRIRLNTKDPDLKKLADAVEDLADALLQTAQKLS